MTTDTLRSGEAEACRTCGGLLRTLYPEVQDYAFGSPGSWAYDRCTKCRQIQICAIPTRRQLDAAYAGYYTHASSPGQRPSRLKAQLRLAQQAWVSEKLSLCAAPNPGKTPRLGRLILSLWAGRRLDALADYGNLKLTNRRRLIDVGCGNGDFVLRMSAAGWDAEGQEVDGVAAEVASQHCTVHVGDIPSIAVGRQPYDVATLLHVVEHMTDPVRELSEIRKILRPGGLLLIVTPNASSLQHMMFRQYWRGLEAPRHLHIFSARALRRLVEMSGYELVECRESAHAANMMFVNSWMLRFGRYQKFARVLGELVQQVQYFARAKGEELWLVGQVKPQPKDSRIVSHEPRR